MTPIAIDKACWMLIMNTALRDEHVSLKRAERVGTFERNKRRDPDRASQKGNFQTLVNKLKI